MLHNLRADLLLIFDCCYAGFLARDERKWPESDSQFEFLGSAGANEEARGPRSPGSFTRALIQVLNNIANGTRSFTAGGLHHKIVNNPNFRNTEQQPVVSTCGKENSHELRIAASDAVTGSQSLDRIETEQQNFYLHLMCTFEEEPDGIVMRALTGRLLDLVKHDRLPIKDIEYRGISIHNPKMSMADAGKAVLARFGYHLRKSAVKGAEGSVFGDKALNPPQRTLTSLTMDKKSLISRSFSRVGSNNWEKYDGKTSQSLVDQEIPPLIPREVIYEQIKHRTGWIFVSAAILLAATTATRSIWHWAERL